MVVLKKLFWPVLLGAILLTSCTPRLEPEEQQGSFTQITAAEAKEMMEQQDVIILDVREQTEYDAGHIANSVLLPVGTITAETAAAIIPGYDSKVMVYCRSGNRSKMAATKLVALGYQNIYEFGGIRDWPYGTVQ